MSTTLKQGLRRRGGGVVWGRTRQLDTQDRQVYPGHMSENAARPTAAKLYQTPADGGGRAQTNYVAPGVPASREPEATLGVRRNASAHTTEPQGGPGGGGSDRRGGPGVPRVGDTVQHRVSGQTGTVAHHTTVAHTGAAMPHVVWQGEEASWPQGVSANALRVVGSTPNDLYQYNQDATSNRPMRGSTGAT